jgi:4-aminobutyrate aminotransferase-like enzyme
VLIGVGGGLANVLRIQSPLSISNKELTQVVDALKVKDILEANRRKWVERS